MKSDTPATHAAPRGPFLARIITPPRLIAGAAIVTAAVVIGRATLRRRRQRSDAS